MSIAICNQNDSLGMPMQTRNATVSGISFSPSGRELVVSYSSEHIYSFSVRDHARGYDDVAKLPSRWVTGLAARLAAQPSSLSCTCDSMLSVPMLRVPWHMKSSQPHLSGACDASGLPCLDDVCW